MPEFATVDGEPHLGGYVPGGDEATYYPDMWKWLVTDRGVRSMLDVGCGEGHAMQFFQSLGVRARGIDGVDQGNSDIVVHDYTKGPKTWRYGFDLVWCCELLEHVEERYVPNLRLSLTAAPLVLVTHAEPGQDGFHHVNCRTADYWIGVFAGWGYQLDDEMTRLSRAISGAQTSPWNHYLRSGLAFRAG